MRRNTVEAERRVAAAKGIKTKDVRAYYTGGRVDLAAEYAALEEIAPGYDIRLTEEGDVWSLEDGIDWALE